MGINFGKMVLILIFSLLIFANSCESEYYGNKLQVYNEDGTKFNATFDLVGLPSARLASGHYPWKLSGRIVNGKMAIDFPKVKLEIPKGEKVCGISIERKNYRSMKFGLHRKDPNNSSRVYIYYATENLRIEGMALKAGWNFVEEIQNPNWSWDTDESYFITGLISQNINDFFRKGYRWQVEFWT